MDGIVIREAVAADAPAITRIYNYAIVNTTATFDTEEKTTEDRLAWLSDHDGDHPVIVAEQDGEVVGWASLSRYAERPAYRHTVENAVYVSPEHCGMGIGRALLTRLIELSDELGHHAIIALVVAGNEASLRLHERLGFETVGVMKEVGRKFDKWLDVVVMERIA